MAFGITIPCDDLTVTIGGTEYRPREGQTITIRPSLPLGISKQAEQFQRDLLRMPDNPSEAIVDETYEQMETFLGAVILGWTWTGPDGEVLPTPSVDPGVVEREMSQNDFTWIMALYQRTQDDEEKKGDAV